MRVAVELRVGADGGSFLLSPGDIIGRSPRAALSLDDPHVSEAHAMVSLRGAALVLLRLRGRLRVEGKIVAEEVALEPGRVIEVAPGLELHCLDVLLPETTLGLDFPGLPAFALVGTTSLWTAPGRVLSGACPDAAAVVWAFGDGWRIMRGGDLTDLVPGATLAVDGGHVRVIEVPVAACAAVATRTPSAGPVVFIVTPHAVHLRLDGPDAHVIGGMPARLLGALLRAGGARSWRDLADCLWPGDQNAEHPIRRRFDAALARLRDKLALAVAGERIRLDGAGGVMFQPRPGDAVELSP